MCGISGIFNPHQKINKSDLNILVKNLSHRGPDDIGVITLGNVGLTHCRLSIIDLSNKGHQPMSDHDKNLWITFNGEIYNYQEVRENLIQKGYTFISDSDTEVILYAYKEYGVDCLKHFRGMFAFAIYDITKKTLFAARDRLGKKPFKYFFDGENFAFASEVNALLELSFIEKSSDQEALEEFLYWGFIPSPKTGFQNIFKLPAAHYLLFHNKKLTIKKYWDYLPVTDPKMAEPEAIEQLQKIVTDSVRLRMISDVPIGAFLSGGIDSCIVVGLMSKLSDQPINTFTIGFDGWKDNESELAKISSKFHLTNHQEFTVKPQISEILPKIIRAYGEPFGDVSAIPSYYVSQMASEHVKVVLNGDGGDELFLGYSNYTTFDHIEKLSSLKYPAKISQKLLKPFQSLGEQNIQFQRLIRLSDLLGDKPAENYHKYARGYLNLISFHDLFLNNKYDPKENMDKILPKNASDWLSAISYMDLHNILPDGLMTKVDIASMQFGLEARSPLLDHKLVEFAATIPTNLKIKNKQTKYILRKAFADLIPQEINKQPKRGFVMPVDQWFRNELKPLLTSELMDQKSIIFKLVKFDMIQKILNLHFENRVDYSVIIWKLLVLSIWLKQNFNSKSYD